MMGAGRPMILAIFVSGKRGERQSAANEVEVVAGCGIVGDRNFRKTRWPGQNITFIESEEIDSYNRNFAQNIPLDATHRNIITQGVRLNSLVGREFSVGDVRFKGIELCEPCSVLGKNLENQRITKREVVRAFVHKAGLRADILSDGKLAVGMEFVIS